MSLRKHSMISKNSRLDKVIALKYIERFELRDKRKEVTKTDNQLKSLQSVGQIIGEVLKEITKEKCKYFSYLDIIKSSAGTRNVVGVKVKLDRSKLVVGARVALDQTTQTIMQVLPR